MCQLLLIRTLLVWLEAFSVVDETKVATSRDTFRCFGS